jgi:hypothetical protein
MNNMLRAMAFLLLVVLAPSLRAQVVAINPAAVVSASRDAARQMVQNLPIDGHYPLSQLLHIGVTDGMLNGELVAELGNQVTPYRIDVENSTAMWTVRKRVIGAGSQYVIVTRFDFDAPADELWSTVLTLRAGYFAVNGMSGDTGSGLRVRLTQANGTLSFTCTTIDRGSQRMFVNASAATLKQLQLEHPQELRRYLMPMLRKLTGRNLLRPGATDVYRVFDQIRPAPPVVKQLDDLLVRLESDVYAVRDQASKDLASLGSAAVLAALRRDISGLSAEARNRLDLFISNHSNLPIEDARAALKDGPFLLDCLDDEDVNVRVAAKDALERLIKRPVEFDPVADDEGRAAAVDGLRKTLDSVFRPAATRPARGPVAPG